MKLALAASLALLALGAASAEASQWHMNYLQAKHATQEYARGTCKGECIEWAVGPCYRKSSSSFTCFMGHTYPGSERGEVIICNTALHWGVREGYVALKSSGRPDCFVRYGR